jgi:hypothetical protein
MTGDHLAADRQPDAVAGKPAAAMGANEHIKDTPGIFCGNADPVIAHGEEPLVLLALRPDMDTRSFVTVKLDGIAEQLRKTSPSSTSSPATVGSGSKVISA